MKKAYFLIVLFLCGLSVGNLFAAASAAAAEDDLGKQLREEAGEGDEKKVERLIAAGADVNELDYSGGTALMEAVIEGHENIVELLLQEGANVNAQDDYGFTALMWAAANGNTDMVNLLLLNGADKDLKNEDGEMAEDIARDARYDGHADIANMIRDYKSGRRTKAAR